MRRRCQSDICCRKGCKQIQIADGLQDITHKSSSPNCCFLNLKYSSMRHLIRYTFATMWHKRFFSCMVRLLSSSMGSVPKPYTAFILKFHTITTLIFSCHIHVVTGFPVINDIPVFLCPDHKTLTEFQKITVIIIHIKAPVQSSDTFFAEIFGK